MADYANEEEVAKLKATIGDTGGDPTKREIIMPGGYRGTKKVR